MGLFVDAPLVDLIVRVRGWIADLRDWDSLDSSSSQRQKPPWEKGVRILTRDVDQGFPDKAFRKKSIPLAALQRAPRI